MPWVGHILAFRTKRETPSVTAMFDRDLRVATMRESTWRALILVALIGSATTTSVQAAPCDTGLQGMCDIGRRRQVGGDTPQFMPCDFTRKFSQTSEPLARPAHSTHCVDVQKMRKPRERRLPDPAGSGSGS